MQPDTLTHPPVEKIDVTGDHSKFAYSDHDDSNLHYLDMHRYAPKGSKLGLGVRKSTVKLAKTAECETREPGTTVSNPVTVKLEVGNPIGQADLSAVALLLWDLCDLILGDDVAGNYTASSTDAEKLTHFMSAQCKPLRDLIVRGEI